MNFYKHHIGDYAQATAHLSFVEDAAYSRLIRKYYAEESPLPSDIKAVQRLIGARTREEKQAVEDILSEFFYLEADGWHNKRCDAELGKANAQAETNRLIAIEREARRKLRTSNEQSTIRAKTVHESCNESLPVREPSQTPDSRLQTPIKPTSQPDASARDPEKFPMHIGWKPSDEFATLAKMAMVTVADGKLGEFIAHWLTQPHQRSQAEWDKALLQSATHDKLRGASPLPQRGRAAPDNFAEKDYGKEITAL